MKSRRGPTWIERFRTLLSVIVVLVFLAASGYLAVKWWRRGVPDHEVAAGLCQAGYRRAHTQRDTLIVDARRPVTGRLQATQAMSCGAMRQAGMLR